MPAAFRLNERYHPHLLFIITAGTFYMSLISGGFIHLDDVALISKLINDQPFSLKNILLGAGTTYYRPIIELSYRLDHLIWFDVAFGYHQTNVIHHTLNVFLVYIATLLLFKNVKADSRTVAFISTSFFAINPLLSESVCWVSGRSDIIAANFILSSFIFYMLFKNKKKSLYLFPALLFFILAMLTKEVALALPAIVLFFELFYQRSFGFTGSRRAAVITLLLLIVAGMAYLFMRGGSIGTGGMSVAVGETGLTAKSWIDNIRILFASYGFYFKKLFFPYPLNFAIHRINEPLYALAGVAGLTLVARSVFRPGIYGFFAVWIVLTLSPAVAAGILMIPWTPWAERFLYLPMAGFSMAVCYGFMSLKEKYKKRAVIPFAVIILIFWASTQHRIYLWTDELRLWEDTASKTDYGPVYHLYGKVLYNRGQDDKAIEVLEKGIAKGYTYKSYLTLADIRLSRKEYPEYEKIMMKAAVEFPKKKKTLKLLAEGYLNIAMAEKDEHEKYTLKAIDTYKKYLEPNGGDIKTNFRIAALYKSIHRQEEGAPFLQKVVELNPDSRYAATALKALKELKQNEP